MWATRYKVRELLLQIEPENTRRENWAKKKKKHRTHTHKHIQLKRKQNMILRRCWLNDSIEFWICVPKLNVQCVAAQRQGMNGQFRRTMLHITSKHKDHSMHICTFGPYFSTERTRTHILVDSLVAMRVRLFGSIFIHMRMTKLSGVCEVVKRLAFIFFSFFNVNAFVDCFPYAHYTHYV